jgi:4-amino-4-deoxy-L-arabinose transferase-like glycosyltransferase
MKNKYQKILIFILILAALLRFWNFTQTDVYTDEALLGLRAIGLIDFDSSEVQQSPWQWVNDIPGWMHLSMSDHPLGIFLLQHFSFKIFSANTFGLRFPSVVAGVATIYLIYLLGKKLFKEKVGLLAAFILSLSPYHLWVSRVGLQESAVIAFGLAAFYFLILSLENKKKLLWAWSFLGLCLLTKYTALIFLPIFFLIIWHQKKIKEFLRTKYFWLGLLLFLIIISPTIIYNLKMQQTFGHLDFQLSELFQQKTEHWQVRAGRELAGDFQQKVTQLPLRLKEGLSWPALIIFIAGLGALSWRALKQKSNATFFLLITILSWLFWFLIIGATRRFLSYLSPFVALTSAWFIFYLGDFLQNKRIIKKIFFILLLTVFVFELFFSGNTFFTVRPYGRQGLTWSEVNFEIRSYGFKELENYLDQLLVHKRPAASFPPKYDFLTKIKDEALIKMKEQKLEATPLMIVYDNNIAGLAALWLFHRRLIYEGWPILDAQTYVMAIKNEGVDIFSSAGVKTTYFISVNSAVIPKNEKQVINFGSQLKDVLIKQKIQPEIIKNKLGETAFEIYKF